jgi:hypothetical protein
MVKDKDKLSFRFMLKRYMLNNYIEDFKELSRQTGINYDTLGVRISKPETLRKFEIKLLDDVLHFSDEDLITLIRG